MMNRHVMVFKFYELHIYFKRKSFEVKKKDLQVMNKLPSQGVQLPLKPEKKEGY